MDGAAVPGKLKLKKGACASVEPNKRRPKRKADDADKSTIKPPTKTKAELTFERRQAELQVERVKKKAQKSHREKVEEFNDKMNELTEFNDIPKVSWTK